LGLTLQNVWSPWQGGREIGLQHPDEPAGPVPQPDAAAAGTVAGAEAALVQACRAGSVSAFEQLYQSHGAKMKSIAYNLLGNTSDAEDAVQETFLKAYRAMGSFKGDSSLSTWVTRILINTCRDLHRRRVRKPELQELHADAEDNRPAAEPRARGDHPLRVVLENCLAQLEERRRTVFLLFEVEGLRHTEIGEILGISEASSKNTLFQAKRELREMLLAARRSGKTFPGAAAGVE